MHHLVEDAVFMPWLSLILTGTLANGCSSRQRMSSVPCTAMENSVGRTLIGPTWVKSAFVGRGQDIMIGTPLPPLRVGKEPRKKGCEVPSRVGCWADENNRSISATVGMFLFVSFTSRMTNKTYRGAAV